MHKAKRLLLLVGLGLMTAGVTVTARAQMEWGVSGNSQGVDGFYLALGNYFRVPDRDVAILREKSIPEDEIAVVLYVAARAHVAPLAVVNLRLAPMSWMAICSRYGLNPDIFFVAAKKKVNRGPYGHAYGYWRKRKVRLTDDDIINFVNLKFISEHYGVVPDDVIAQRSEGKDFREINEGLRRSQGGEHRRWKDEESHRAQHWNWDAAPQGEHGRDEETMSDGHGRDRNDEGNGADPGHGRGWGRGRGHRQGDSEDNASNDHRDMSNDDHQNDDQGADSNQGHRGRGHDKKRHGDSSDNRDEATQEDARPREDNRDPRRETNTEDGQNTKTQNNGYEDNQPDRKN